MNPRRILVLGATGILGQPVVQALVSQGHPVRALVRSSQRASQLLGNSVECVEGNALAPMDVHRALSGCHAVHVNLTQQAELDAMQNVVQVAAERGIERVSYVSATTACEENRWFEVVDIKMRTEEVLVSSGIRYVIFCPTWVMETLQNFVHGGRGTVIIGRNPPKLHFVAAADFGRMVAASYLDERAVGKRLFIHGPEGVTLPNALERFYAACHPQLSVIRMKLWQARLLARITRRVGLTYVTKLIDYFDRVGELGDPTEANSLLGTPSITLDEWFATPRLLRHGLPH
ncbi:MAG: NAD(P)H-binding protein [Planctomycetales bacterium]|nr:NAD(P)H-binding protein [Planctomycetales bacterium]